MKRFILLLILSYIVLPCHAYIEKNMKILTMENGLPSNTINRIYRDIDGFMWFATKKGISRYDGTNFKNFALPQENQVVNNIFGSSENYIWTWGGGVLNCLNTDSEKFMDIVLPDELSSKNAIHTSKVFNDSIAWLITKNSVFKTFVSTDHVDNKRTLTLVSKQLNIVDSNEQILSTDIDDKGNIYLSTTLNKILIINYDNTAIEKNILNLRKSLAHTESKILHIDVIDNSVWVNTSGEGVVRFFIDTKEIQQFDDHPNTKLQIPHTNVFQTVKLKKNQYLFVTWNGYNVITYDETDKIPLSIKNYSNSYSDTHRSVECRIGSVYIDNDNILWLGTFGSGIIVSNLNLQFYKQFHQDITNAIESMAIDHKQFLWISTYHKGVFRSKEPIYSGSNLDFKLISNGVIRGVKTNIQKIVCDKFGNIWGGMRNGVLVMYGENGVEKEMNLSVDSLDTKLAINCMYFDKDSNLWLGTQKGALHVYDMEAGKARLMKNITSERVNGIAEDLSGNLWFSSAKGAIKYDPTKKSVVVFADNFDVTTTLSTNNGLYIGTSSGFISIDSNGDTILHTTKNGLCSDEISSITEGDNDDVWVCSESGISRYSSIDKTLFNYYIQSNTSSTIRAQDGTIFFGNNKSITYFNPATLSDLYKRIRNKKIAITELKIVGETVRPGEIVNGDVVLSKSIQHTDKIILNYKNNNFSLSVSNLLFNDVHQRYMYRMLPIQSAWTTVNNFTPISYMSLPAGKYIFQVKDYSNSNNNKVPITELEIKITEHWIYSLFVKIVGSLLLILVVVALFTRTRLRYKRQLYLAQLNSELELQRSELAREKKTNQERINFFTYASHELRTPLTLIISPIKELSSHEGLTSDIKTKLLNIEQNAQSLLNTADKLLDFQQLDAKITKLNISKVDILELTKGVISNFNILCADIDLEITLTNNIKESQVWLNVDKQKIESIIRNLISNSIKYSKKSGAKIEITISGKIEDSVDYIVMEVIDNGQGISSEAQKTIFESFSTDDNKPIFSTKMGVGLFIVRSIVELHHGKISLSSKINEGTAVKLHIPQNYEYHSEDILSAGESDSEHPLKKKILVIEDNIEILKYIHSLFCNNYNVLTAENGEYGLIVAKEKLPDIILQDVMLPGISGIECCRELINNFATSHIPIILLSAKADEQSIMEGVKAGAADYLIKPFNPHILRTKVASLISSREMLKQIYSKSLMLNSEPADKEVEDNFMQKIINITEQNLTNPKFGVDLLAEKLNMSTSTMRRYIKVYSDLPINSIIRDVRLTKAASLIITQKYRVVEIAEMVGYNDISSFRTQFTKKFGISPSKFHNV